MGIKLTSGGIEFIEKIILEGCLKNPFEMELLFDALKYAQFYIEKSFGEYLLS